MKSAILVAPEQLEIRQIEQPKLSDREVLIQPLRMGICGSDVSFYLGHRIPPYYPFPIGHEFVGRVTAVAPGVNKIAVGQRVIVEPNYTCGECKFCRSGRGNICPNKRSLGVSIAGCFGEYVTAPAEFTWPVPDTIPDVDAATIEPLAVSLHALTQSGTQLGDTIAVIGCGVVGLLLIHVAVAQGVRVLAHDQFPGKLEMAAKLGAEVHNSGDPAKLWLQENVSAVFECAGATSTVELALSAAPRGSKVILLGLSTSPASFIPLRVVREGIHIEPSLIYDHPRDFESAINLVAHKVLEPSKIVTESLPFDSIAKALQIASTGKSGKIHAVLS
jgi:threonine dehydrogenase-like Zn-dependent dehydrogenase